MIKNVAGKTFLISRIDAIGDVVLTLPMAGWLKKHVPHARVLFLGRTYTAPVVACCLHVDEFLNWDEISKLTNPEQKQKLQAHNIDSVIHVFPNKQIAVLARRAGIKQQIGTRNRWFHWIYANTLVALSRRHSAYHESQLNMALLQPLGLTEIPALDQVTSYLNMAGVGPLPEKYLVYLQTGKPAVILHPKSKGSAREWGLAHFAQLARELHAQGWQVIISGSAPEHDLLKEWLEDNKPFITDVTGKLTLPEFISLIKVCRGLVGASTGPLHLAAALGRHALGLYPPIKPMHPGRWAPIGPFADYLVLPKDCRDCRNNPATCVCINQISVASVVNKVEQWK